MRVLTFTVVADGASDRALIPIVEWLLLIKLPDDQPFVVRIAEGVPPPKDGLSARVKYAQKMYPCDAMLIHRDSENIPWADRVAEIQRTADELNLQSWLPIVPVRTTEAWLLLDQVSIRRAASNPNGDVALNLPKRSRWTTESDPKSVLFAALKTASELKGRRLEKFDVYEARARVASLINDFGELRGIPSFDDFEQRLGLVLNQLLEQVDV
jgi:hypothetical protein